MAVEISFDPVTETACMWDTTTDIAFGPVFSGPSANVEVNEFLDWLRENTPHWAVATTIAMELDGTDPRHYEADELARLVRFWCDLPTDEDGNRFDPDDLAARAEDAAIERAERKREGMMFDRDSWEDEGPTGIAAFYSQRYV